VPRFLLLGSGEFESWSHEAETAALAEATGDGSVVILPAASAPDGDRVFERWGNLGLAHYAEAGVSASILPVRAREQAMDAATVEAVRGASMFFFSGGKPQHLANVLRDTPLLEGIVEAMGRGAVWAGCSAGAMVVSRARDADGRRGTSWLFGLGLVPHVSFGVHWDKARKIPGAAWWFTSRLPEDTWFVGIDERTAVLGDGITWRVHGLGGVDLRGPGIRRTLGAGASFETPQASR
jgi:cyanophycinase-like exopeptidase